MARRSSAAQQAADPLSEEARDRLADCRQQKAHVQRDIEECYFFSAPRRVRAATSQSSTTTKTGDEGVLQTSLGFICAEDYMTRIIDSFMPQAGRWAERLGDPFLPKAEKGRIEKAAKDEDEKIFQVVRGSNFHAELAKQGVPDGAIGVFAMDIRDIGAHLPIRCIGVPIRELEINIGPDGRIDDRFVVKHTKYRHLPALLPGIKLPAAVKEKIRDEPREKVDVTWGYWRKWDRTDDEVWQHVVLVDKEVVHKPEIVGEGCCPLIVGRMGAMPDFAWPEGPMIKSLPTLREIDDMEAGFIENIDFTIRPPVAADDDTLLAGALENGIEPGRVYFRRPRGGAGNSFERIYEPNQLDAALFQKVEKERLVRRLHYSDFPEQLGKTPPTAAQWLDEMVEAQRQIGTPGYAFWREFPYDVFNRFRYLAEMRGGVAKVPGNLHAYNPAQRAQENQEVLTASRFMQIGASAFPQTWQVAVDDLGTLRNIKDKLGDKLVLLRTPEDFQKAAPVIASLAGVAGARLQGGVVSGAQGG